MVHALTDPVVAMKVAGLALRKVAPNHVVTEIAIKGVAEVSAHSTRHSLVDVTKVVRPEDTTCATALVLRMAPANPSFAVPKTTVVGTSVVLRNVGLMVMVPVAKACAVPIRIAVDLKLNVVPPHKDAAPHPRVDAPMATAALKVVMTHPTQDAKAHALPKSVAVAPALPNNLIPTPTCQP